jgi:hypothetical protein
VWLIALVAFLAIGRSVGSTYAKSFSIPGTDSNRAQAVLEADFPIHAGDSDQIVVRAKRGTLRTLSGWSPARHGTRQSKSPLAWPRRMISSMRSRTGACRSASLPGSMAGCSHRSG